MGKATVVRVIAKSTFVADKATVCDAFTTTMLADFKAIGEIVNKYAGKSEFIELRVACFELAIKKSLVKAGLKCDDALANEIATHDATKPDARELTASEKAAKKSARNTWFGFTQKCGIITQDARGGANNPTGKGSGQKLGKGAKPRSTDKVETLTEKASQAPITVASIVVETLPLAALEKHYDSLKHHLIKLQRTNAKVYTGDEGAKLLDKHTRIVAILNEK